jgi:antitoxin ParD1/3/4
MGAVQKLSIALTQELAPDIEAAVASGEYSTASEVVREALRTWNRERQDREAAIQRLKRLWKEGLASGEPEPMADDWAEQVIARGRARLAASKRANEAWGENLSRGTNKRPNLFLEPSGAFDATPPFNRRNVTDGSPRYPAEPRR